MKKITFLPSAQKSLSKYKKDAARIHEKINRYSEAGSGDVKQLVASSEKRLRVGDYRVIFTEENNEIIIRLIDVRGNIYEVDKR